LYQSYRIHTYRSRFGVGRGLPSQGCWYGLASQLYVIALGCSGGGLLGTVGGTTGTIGGETFFGSVGKNEHIFLPGVTGCTNGEGVKVLPFPTGS
jgi:hypothetical protein